MIQGPPGSHKTVVKICGELFPTAVQKRNEEKGDKPLFLLFLRQKGKRIRDVNFED